MDLPLRLGGPGRPSRSRPVISRSRDEDGGSNQSIIDTVKKARVRRPKIVSAVDAMPEDDSPVLRPPGILRRTLSAVSTVARETIRRPQELLFKRCVDGTGSTFTESEKPAQTTLQDPEAQSTHHRGMGGDRANTTIPGVPAVVLPLEGGQKRKYLDGDGDGSSRDRPKSMRGSTAGSEIPQGRQSTEEKNQVILNWIEEQPETAELIRRNTSPQLGMKPRCSSSAASVQFDTDNTRILPLEHQSSLPLQVERLGSPLLSIARAGSQDPRMRGLFQSRALFHLTEPGGLPGKDHEC